MSSGAKEFPASALKLERLRSAGVVPRTLVLLHAAAWGGVLASSLFLFSVLRSSGSAFVSNLLQDHAIDTVSPETLTTVRSLGLVAALIPAVVVILVGLWQTRFLFAVSQIVPQLSRVAAFSETLGGGYGLRTVVALLRVVLATGWAAVGYGVVRYCIEIFQFPRVQYSFASGTTRVWTPSQGVEPLLLSTGDWTVVDHYLVVVLWAAVAAACFFLVYAGCARLVAVISFRQQHRMTRAEVEAEIRESEPSSDMRQRIRNNYNG